MSTTARASFFARTVSSSCCGAGAKPAAAAAGTKAAVDGKANKPEGVKAAGKPVGAKAADPKAPAGRVVPGAKPGLAAKGKVGKRPPVKRSGFSLRNVILFGGLVVILLAAFGVLGNRDGGAPGNAPKWKAGETVNVEITVVTTDYKDLVCAMEGDVKGLHCGFLATNKKNEAAKTSREDEKLLQPFSTTDHVNFLAAGFFMQPELKEKLAAENFERPSPRFSVNCKLVVQGHAKGVKIKWKEDGDAWGSGDPWPLGDVKDCKIAK